MDRFGSDASGIRGGDQIGLVDQQVYTIGIAASDQGEGRAVISIFAVEPTMCEQFEAPVVALDHDQAT
jgi:hypothetical protein